MVKTKKANITTTTITTTTPGVENAEPVAEVVKEAVVVASPTQKDAQQQLPVVKENAEENVVYVYNSRKTEHIPSLSPECLAVETSLRFKKINYKYATPDKCVEKPHGEPIILLNQKEYVGVDKIEEVLATLAAQQREPVIFPELTSDQQADCQAYIYALVDTVLYQVLHIQRFKHTTSTTAELDIIRRVKSGFQRLFSKVNKDEDRLTKMKPEQLVEIGKDGLNAINNYLKRGDTDKTYFFGDKPTKHDAILFGLLMQYWQEPPTTNGGSTTDFSLGRLMETGDENKIMTYLQKIKDTYWPDWTDRCAKPAPPPTSTPNKRGTFRKSKSEQQHAVSKEAAPTTPDAGAVVNGTNDKVTNGMENGDAKETEKKEHENGTDKVSEIKKIDDEPVSPVVEVKAE